MELGSTHKEKQQVAEEGVKLALRFHLIAKPVLQDSLRPILTDLAFVNRITLHLLRHLHVLLVSAQGGGRGASKDARTHVHTRTHARMHVAVRRRTCCRRTSTSHSEKNLRSI